MTFLEFIDEYYDISHQLEMLKRDPIKQIMENDDLPYDDIRYVDGQLQKVVEVADDTYIPVVELISWDEKDIKGINDADIVVAWYAYMEQVDVKEFSIDMIRSSAKLYIENKKAKEGLVERCMQ